MSIKLLCHLTSKKGVQPGHDIMLSVNTFELCTQNNMGEVIWTPSSGMNKALAGLLNMFFYERSYDIICYLISWALWLSGERACIPRRSSYFKPEFALIFERWEVNRYIRLKHQYFLECSKALVQTFLMLKLLNFQFLA